MSEDEIKPTKEEYYMERVNALLEVLNLREFFEYIGDSDYYSVGVGGLVDLYKEEKEKNEELSIIKEGIKVLQNNGLIDEQYIVIANWNLKNTTYKHLLDDYVSKDKIRAKIKELEEKSDYWNCDEIEVLKELLEEN